MNARRPLFLLAIALTSVACFALSPAGDPSVPLTRQADNDLAGKQYNSAILNYQESLVLKPHQPEVRQKLVAVYLLKRNFDRAEAVLEEWSQLTPTDPRPYVSLGEIAEAAGQWDEARERYEKALTFEPRYEEAHHRLGVLNLRLGRFDRAQIEFETLLAQDDADQRAHFRLGQLLAGEYAGSAMGHLRRAFDLGADPLIGEQSAKLLDNLRAGQQEDNRAYAAASLGFAFLQDKEVTLARRQFEAATRLDPQYVDAHAYLGYTWLLLLRPDLAHESLAKAIEIDPVNAFAHHILSRVWRAEGRIDLAIGEITTAEALAPADPFLLSEVALTYLLSGDLNAAEDFYVRATTLAPTEPIFVEQLAHFYLDRMFKVDEGLSAAQRLSGLRPDNGEDLDLLGWAMYLNQQPEEAERTLTQARDLTPDLASVHYHLAVIREKSGRIEEAREAYERAAELDLVGPIEKRALAVLEELAARD